MSHEFNHHQPIYRQLIDHFCQLIVSGSWVAGDRVDSVRNLAVLYEVNPNTIQKALSELEREGLLYTERTSGRFITRDQHLIKLVRQQLACEKTEQFITQMTALGCSKEELVELIQQNWRSDHVID